MRAYLFSEETYLRHKSNSFWIQTRGSSCSSLAMYFELLPLHLKEQNLLKPTTLGHFVGEFQSLNDFPLCCSRLPHRHTIFLRFFIFEVHRSRVSRELNQAILLLRGLSIFLMFCRRRWHTLRMGAIDK